MTTNMTIVELVRGFIMVTVSVFSMLACCDWLISTKNQSRAEADEDVQRKAVSIKFKF